MIINIAGAALVGMSSNAIKGTIDLECTPNGPEALVTIDGKQVTGSINGQPAHMVDQTTAKPNNPAVVPGVSGGSTAPGGSPQAGVPVITENTSGFSLGEFTPDAEGTVLIDMLTHGGGEARIKMPGQGRVNIGLVIPADAPINNAPGQVKLRSVRDNLWGVGSISYGRGDLFDADRQRGPSASQGFAYVFGPEDAIQENLARGYLTMIPGRTLWVNYDKMNDDDLVVQITSSRA